MVYGLKNEWQEIAEAQGTFYAPERSVEISHEQKAGSGFILDAGIPCPFKAAGKLYARATSGHAQLNVVNMTASAV